MAGDLSNRDIAFLGWLAVAAAVVLVQRGGREGIASILRAFWGKVALITITFAAYIAVAVVVGQRVGVWNTGLFKDTIAWFLVPGMVLLFGFTRAYEGRQYYLRKILGVIGLTAAVEFYLNLGGFPLWIEIILLPTLVLLGTLSAVAGLKPETIIVKQIVDRLLGVVGVALFVGTGAYLVGQWSTLDKADLALSFALPIWLTLASLPFIFLFSLYANYEATFARIDLATKDDPRARRRAKAALITSFHLRNRQLHAFTGRAPGELAAAKSWGEARRIIAYHRSEIRLREAKEDLAAKKLIRYAGVQGTDWEGQPLDQREFAETKQALTRLAMFHQAQFKNGRYRANLMEMVAGLLSDTFPETEITMTFGKKGRSWFAWRRTVTGWCLGIGAAGPPPDHWVYEGPRPPNGSPHDGGGWKRGDFDDDSDEEE